MKATYYNGLRPQLPAFLLCGSFRQNCKVKNRTVANLSHWAPARIDALRRLPRGEFDQAAELAMPPNADPCSACCLF